MLTHNRNPDLGIDLGTANTLAVSAGSDPLFDQPTVCCFKAYDAVPTFVAAGAQAHLYVGKAVKPFKIVHPLKNGVLSDMDAARELLRHVRRSIRPGRRIGRPRPVIGVPGDATQAERRALASAALDAGFAEPELIAEPLLAAIGLGLDVDEPRGRMILDCGAGTTDAAVISLGGICVSHTVRGGGEALDQALVDHLHLRHRFLVGMASGEQLKRALGTALRNGAMDDPLEVRGLDSATGLPRRLFVEPSELLPIWDRHAEQIAGVATEALQETPPELCQDIMEDGIHLTGGGAMDSMLAERVSERTGIAVHVAETPLLTVSVGLARILADRRG